MIKINKKTVKTLSDNSKFLTYEQLFKFVKRHIKYKSEKNDSWTPPEETLKRGYGDCEDFALVVKDLCQKNGYICKIFVAFQKGLDGRTGHVYCLVENVGNPQSYWLTSNGDYYKSIGSILDGQKLMYKKLAWKNAFSIELQDQTIANLLNKDIKNVRNYT